MKKYIYLSFIVLFITTGIFAQPFTDAQQKQIQEKANALLTNYQKYCGITDDGISQKPEFIENFRKLFNSETTQIINDIDPRPTASKYIAIKEYLTNMQSWYNQGLDSKIVVSQNFTNITKASGNEYYLIVLASKRLFGVFKNERILNYTGKMSIKIRFSKSENGVLENFIIYEIFDEADFQAKSDRKKSRGVYLELLALPSYSIFKNDKMSGDPNWTKTDGINFKNYGVHLDIFLNRVIAFTVGVEFSTYSFKAELTNYSSTSSLKVDKDNDSYYRVVQANIQEKNTIQYMEIPIGIILRFGGIEKTRFFIAAGLKTNSLKSAKCEVSGLSAHMGYYPKYHVLFEDLPEYDFTTESNTRTVDWELNKSNQSAYFTMGLMIPFGKRIFLKTAATGNYGMKDLQYIKPKHRDDFLSTNGTAGTTFLHSATFELGLIFKFF